MRSGSTMTAISARHSSSQHASMPRYGNMPIGASPAKAFGALENAGASAVVNSSQGDDHSTSSRGGSGHLVMVSGMVSTWFSIRLSLFRTHARRPHSSNHGEVSPRFQHPDQAPRESVEGVRRKTV